MLDYECSEHGARFLEAVGTLARVNSDVLEELAGGVDGHALAAGAQTRIDADDRALAERRRQQQVAQVAGEDLDRVAVGAQLELDAHVGLDRRREQALVAVGDGLGELGRERRGAHDSHLALDERHGALGRHFELGLEHALALAAPDREEAVRRDGRNRLAEVVVLLELGRLLRLFGHRLGR